MTAPALAPIGPAAGNSTITGFLRRNRTAVLLAVGVLVTLLVLTWLGRDRGGRGGDLDPENPGPEGARAVAQVLGDQGVPVRIVRGQDALAAETLDADSTVVVSNPSALGDSTWADLDDRVQRAGAVLVVAGLSPAVIDGIGIGQHELQPGTGGDVAADCDPARDLLDGLELRVRDGLTVPGDGCFGDAGGRYLLVDRVEHRWVLTESSPFSNDEVDRADNAAVVLRLLGQHDRVVWYVADDADTDISDAVSLSRLLPKWLEPSLWLLGVAVAALLLWRGRRLGPLVVEPIPVTIRALESTTALGRLYERARDREHAAGILVAASAARLTPLVGLAGTPARTALVTAVAERTGRSAVEVAALLPEPANVPAQVRSDTDLVSLARNLHKLEEEVRNR